MFSNNNEISTSPFEKNTRKLNRSWGLRTRFIRNQSIRKIHDQKGEFKHADNRERSNNY